MLRPVGIIDHTRKLGPAGGLTNIAVAIQNSELGSAVDLHLRGYAGEMVYLVPALTFIVEATAIR